MYGLVECLTKAENRDCKTPLAVNIHHKMANKNNNNNDDEDDDDEENRSHL